MATKPLTQVAQPLVAPQHFVHPTVRELRAQAVHRLQVGLFGLAAMLLLVGLANIIMDRARLADEASGLPRSADVASSAAANSDPLADIGVVPAADPTADSVSASAKRAGTAPR
jgi:hypothetical protein